VFQFIETARDNNQIILHDASRNIQVALPIDSGQSYYAIGNSNWVGLYDVVKNYTPSSTGNYSIDAGVLWSNGKAYFFKDDKYIRVNVAPHPNNTTDPGYPKSIAGNWPGWPPDFTQGIDAAVAWNTGKAYFFKGSRYIRVNIAPHPHNTMDPGYPKPIAGNWPGWPPDFQQGIDAAIAWNNGKAYFFKGSRYIRVNLGPHPHNTMDPGYPKPIAGNWPGWPPDFSQGIDAAVPWSTGKAYFFKGNRYIRVNMGVPPNDKMDKGYPKPIAGNWPGWPQNFQGKPKRPDKPPKQKPKLPKDQCQKAPSHLDPSPAGASPRIAGQMYFCFDQRELGDDEKNLIMLNESSWRRGLDKMLVQIGFVGYADKRGDEAYNYELAIDRAINVKDYMLQTYKHKNLKLLNIFSWGESLSDPTKHDAYRRVDVFVLNFPLPRKRVPLGKAVKRCKEILNKYPFDPAQKKRLMCLLNKILDKQNSDYYFSKNNHMYKDYPGGAPNELIPVFFNQARVKITAPEFASEKIPDHQVKSNLETLDEDIREGLEFLEKQATHGIAEDRTTQQIRERVHLLQKSKTSIYWCYGEGESK
jgi:outer membrane protein OmpA-like peptidoglycan-associated protein